MRSSNRAGIVMLLLAAGACAGPPEGQPFPPIRFEEVASKAGIGFVLDNDATPEKHQIETMPAGVGVIDFDGDGFEDIYFINAASIPALSKSSPSYWNRLYRNNGDGTFTDVTERAGVAGEVNAGAVVSGFVDNGCPNNIRVVGV